MKTIRDYHDLYIVCDYLLLFDVFKKFRTNSLRNYGLCPSHQLSAPSLSWYAMLKMPKIKLEPITDPDMYIFFEKSTREGTSAISNRYNKASNKSLKSNDQKQKTKFIINLYPNNWYRYV